MMNFIDNILNRITMYRLVLYYLIMLVLVAAGFGALGLVPYTSLAILLSAAYITFVCFVMNLACTYIFKAPANVESVYITGLILALIITPGSAFTDIQFLFFGYCAAVIAILSKFILAISKKHVFNPAAIAVVLTSILINQSASWWVATAVITPFVLFGGLLLTRKIRRFDLALSFILVALAGIIGSHLDNPAGLPLSIYRSLVTAPIFFFAFAMLTEPLTTPPTANLRIVYGALVGFLFVPALHLGSLYTTPELALILGNVFSYLVSPKQKLILALKQIITISADSYDFVFTSDKKLSFKAGQYLEWTLGHKHPDNRGNRRYFTISSAPSDREISVGVRFYPQSSSFKTRMLAMVPGDTIVVSQLAGDFVLPKKPDKKLVFIAGGIGVTPFRSMIAELLRRLERRSITMFYSGKSPTDFSYTAEFDAAETELGVKTVYTITDKKAVPTGWVGEQGRVNYDMVNKYVPDYRERTFYLSGPQAMVVDFEKTLASMGIPKHQIKKDYFPGFA